MGKPDITCNTGLEPGIIDSQVFERELTLCEKLSRENNGKCGWGRCENCGVIPLLYKFHKGQLLENPDEIKEIKEGILGTSGGFPNV